MKISLDLLPKQMKSELKRKRIFRRILHEEFLFLLPVLLLIVILLNVYYLLLMQRDSSIAAKSLAQSQDKYQELSSYEEKFKQVNDNAAKLLKIQSNHLHWVVVFNKLSDDMPEGITVTDFSTKEYKVFLIGKAKSREVLLDFKGKLEADDCLADVDVPLSNLVTKENIDFQIDFSIRQECLKKQ